MKFSKKCKVDVVSSCWSRHLKSKTHAKNDPMLNLSDELMDWLCEEVLPTLRKTGQYKVETEMNEQKLKLLEWLQSP